MASEITPDDTTVLQQQDTATLCRWWCELNCWKWPDDLPNPEAPTYSANPCRRGAILAWIHEAVGHRELNRHWNVDYNKSMTHDEWNTFWRGHYEGHEPFRRLYQNRLNVRVAQAVKDIPHPRRRP